MYWRNDGLFYGRQCLPVRTFDLHRIFNPNLSLLNVVQFITLMVFEYEGVANAQGHAIYFIHFLPEDFRSKNRRQLKLMFHASGRVSGHRRAARLVYPGGLLYA